MNRITRGERLLEKLVASGSLTPQGRDFLVATLDPMHDNQLTSLSGFPDVESSASIVRCVKQSYTINKPTPGAAGNYDVVIHTIPALGLGNTRFQKVQKTGTHVGAFNALTLGMELGHVVLAFYENGQTSYDINNADKIDFLDLDSSYLTDAARLIGSGLEVTNTTADIYKQGTATVVRVPQRAPVVTVCTSQSLVGSGVEDLPIGYYMTEKWPSSLADALIISGTRQWKAEDGAYVVEAFCGQDNPPRYQEFSGMILPDHESINDINRGSFPLDVSYDVYASQPRVAVPLTSKTRFLSSALFTPTHSSTVMLTGLSQQSTFNLQWNLYIESFPDFGDPSIAVLAKPSCVYDSLALHLLSECLNTLPVGVEASENPFGEWFTRIVSEVADFAAPMLAPVLGPEASLGALALGKAARAWHDANYKKLDNRQLKNYKDGGYVAAPSSMQKPKQQPANRPQQNNGQQGKKKRRRRKRNGNVLIPWSRKQLATLAANRLKNAKI